MRLGFVKITQHRPGGDLVRAYQGRGGYFGEMGLIQDAPRSATCTAVDHVEVVRISADDFRLMLERFPEVAKDLLAEAERRARENVEVEAHTANVDLEDFLRQGLMQAQSLLLLDLDRCTRCDLCVQACATAHDGVTRLVREGLRFENYLVATSCRQCRDPLCMVARSAVATRSRSRSRTGASGAVSVPRTARTATSTCTDSGSRWTTTSAPAVARPSCARKRPSAISARTWDRTRSRAAWSPAPTGRRSGWRTRGSSSRPVSARRPRADAEGRPAIALIDVRHRRWIAASVVLGAIATAFYVPYARQAPDGPRGSTAEGLGFGIAAAALMAFELLLNVRKRVPTLNLWEGDRYFLPLVFERTARQFHGVMPYRDGRPVSWSYSLV